MEVDAEREPVSAKRKKMESTVESFRAVLNEAN